MRLTKHPHSCVALDGGQGTVVIDPGVFSQAAQVLAGAAGILITHEHPDHVDVDAVRTAAAQNRQLAIWAPDSVVALLADIADRITPVAPGERFEVAGLRVQTFGGQHALIHSSVPVCQNVGYLVEERLYHPGDSYVVPPVPVQTLLLPVNAPWAKISETLDFLIATRADTVYQIHDGLLSDNGRSIYQAHLTRVGQEYGSPFTHLPVADQVEV